MGEKSNDGGQFFTPREVIRAIVHAITPIVGKTVFDPCCGTGGLLAQACEYMRSQMRDEATPEQWDRLRLSTFYGRESASGTTTCRT
jgi:type I restriction enzyme M protein